MSYQQSRSDKSETQYRKSGRSVSSNQQRGTSGAYGKGSGGPAPSPSLSSNRSFKKSNHNAQGGQSRASVPTVNSSDSNASTPRGVQNGAHVQQQLHGADAPVTIPAAKQAETPAPQRSFRGVPKAPTSQYAPVSSESTATTNPTKVPDDGSKVVTFQFGSISPGFMNGMQIPARTSSAPPNLDEQKHDQARHNSFRAVPSLPTPNVPKQQLPRKDPVAFDQPNTHEAHPVPKVKKDAQAPPAPPASQAQKPSGLSRSGISVPIPYHQSQVSMQFGGPNQQIQSQGVTASSLQMPLPLPLQMGSAPQVQQPVFVPGLQPHPMQHQGIMHQGQNLSFTTQMGQLPPQLGNLGINIAPQYPQQPGGKFSTPRKTTVKITNPKTHEEVRFDKRSDGYSDGGSSGPRSHPNAPPQSQSIPSFAAPHPISYYAASYNAGNMYFPTPSSLPLTSGQMPPGSQARFNYPVSQGPQNVTVMNPPAHNSLSVSKSGTHMHGILEPPNLEHARDIQSLVSSVPSGATHVTVKLGAGSVGEKAEALSNNSTTVEKSELPKPLRPSAEVSFSHSPKDTDVCTDRSLQQSKFGSDSNEAEAVVVPDPSAATAATVTVQDLVSTSFSSSSAVPLESIPVIASSESRRKESLSRSNSIKDQQKKQVKKGFSHSQQQVGGQSISVSTLPSQTSEHGPSSESVVAETLESNSTLTPLVTNEDVPEATNESLSTTRAASTDASVAKAERIIERSPSSSSEISVAETAVGTSGFVIRKEDQGDKTSEGPKQGSSSSEVSSEQNFLQSAEVVKQGRVQLVREESGEGIVVPEESGSRCMEDGIVDDKVIGSSAELTSTMDASSSKSDGTINDEVSLPDSGRPNQQSSGALAIEAIKREGSVGAGGSMENLGGAGVSVPVGSKDKPELCRTKSTSKGKKKKKELLQKADAAGTTSDLYTAYKGPEEKKETVVDSEVAESTSCIANSDQVIVNVPVDDVELIDKDAGAKSEPDDWEDAADVSKPKLETSDNGEHAHLDKEGNKNTVKKYSRDFLLKFAEQFTDVPGDFEIPADTSEALMNPSVNASHVVDRNSFPSPGRIIDRPGAPRLDRRGSGMIEEDRWSKLPSPYGQGRGLRLDLGFVPNPGFQPGQGGNFGVLKYPRVQTPVQYAGGILIGPLHSLGPQGIQRNSPDSDRWQRAANFHQKGLIPSPQTQLVMMHKTDKKYEVGKVTDEEEAKQRQLKGILNKLTPQNFEKLFEQVKAVNIDNAGTLRGVIAQIFDKALMEPTFCEMYANFCFHLSGELLDFSENNEKITFKRLLLNKCQEEFERGEREQEEANKADEEGEVKQSEEEREEKRIKARRRMLGNIRLIGELYKKKMLTERIMHECIKKLLGQPQTPDEEDVEALCKLMSTIGEIIDHPKAKEHMDAYFEGMKSLSNNMKLSSRVRFMLKDAIDLRKNKWQQRRKVEGPKKIEEVHRDAAQERQAQASRLSRGSGLNPSGRRGPPMDYGPRGSAMLSSPSSQLSGYRTLPAQVRGFGNSQDVRVDLREPFEARTLSVPLAQGPDDAITLGPQGGLARGMSIRGPPSMSSASLADISGDSRRLPVGLNGYGSMSDRAYSPREDLIPRFIPDRFSGQAAYEQSNAQERNINYGSRDLRNSDAFDRSLPTSPPARGQAPTSSQNTPTENTLSEDRLREKSRTAIKEFYSAKDEKEVALCIKELNSPSFHPTMIYLWVTDSFEGKDVERDLLSKLLVNLTKSHGDTLSQLQLIKGFESVLTSLEDTVTDAPKAPEYLGQIFAEVITGDVVSLEEIGQLIHDGGEEPGSLVNAGLAGDVLGNILEIIRSEEGEKAFKETIKRSNLRLETFRPPDPLKSKILEKFI
ncbi:26S proteasome regulatory complex, non-ATPase subcomplex, Rpn1 subunit [Parasponia andersonii]|uniref:Eukaryotic translation initiation factor 4G n=1 Tax=Parasponia andersonii TaxID=3476 RepID=A0A2P5CCX8_PARAD|nr:26S proteasome regulatory complex, non-ATPase subcomplex, Rpn1 subunit [Parasponia andersonii]